MAKKERTAEEVAAKAARKAARASLKAGKQKAPISTATPSLYEKLDVHSPIQHITTSFYLALSPCAYNDPVGGLLAEHISPHLLSYYPPLNGVLLGFENARISESQDEVVEGPSDVLARSFNEYAVSFLWLTCDFVIFRPAPGTYLEGEINLQNEGLLGLICFNYFNVSIPKENMPSDWTWNGQTWSDGEGKLDQKIICKVQDFEASGQESISITGTLVGL